MTLKMKRALTLLLERGRVERPRGTLHHPTNGGISRFVGFKLEGADLVRVIINESATESYYVLTDKGRKVAQKLSEAGATP